MGDTKIEWSEKVWNPVRGCSRVSPGCENCYAERQSARFCGPGQYAHGYAERTTAGARWTRKVALIPEKLAEPLSWRKPLLVFVNSMSDLFHEKLTNEEIAAVFGVMAACPHLTFQVLTKRAERLPEFFRWIEKNTRGYAHGRRGWLAECLSMVDEDLSERAWQAAVKAKEARNGGPPKSLGDAMAWPWPLPNVWIGVSVEDQQRADERIPFLLRCPAAVRFLSCEPLLGPVDLDRWIGYGSETMGLLEDPPAEGRLSWVICGGESGSGARSFDLNAARDLRDQCREAGVPFFMKQAGSNPEISRWRPEDYGSPFLYRHGNKKITLKDRKGGDPEEWPEDLRVREIPR